MKRIVFFFLAVVLVAGLAGFGTLQLSDKGPRGDDVAAHEWLHRELKLTGEQERALEPVETKFAEKQRQLSAALLEANRALARAMGEEKGYTPRVAAAVETVHQRMGDLQKASIEHVFDMRGVLSPEQGDKLLALARKSLEESH
jgi:nickel and cobalt resistance protein CnrR